MAMNLARKKIWVAGHHGMVGSALVRRLQAESGVEILTASRGDADLTDRAAVARWMAAAKPDLVFLAAAKVGGIMANAIYPVDFLAENLAIELNVIGESHRNGVEKLLFLGSSCIYPKLAEQPINEDSLLTGPLEPTNEWYAVAKIAGIKLCQAHRKQFGSNFISAMPTNLYGPNDNYDFNSSHVLPALIRKVHDAKIAGADEIVLWGTGSPLREFMHVDDLADACVFLMTSYSNFEHVNVGSGSDLSILELARQVCQIVDFQGEIRTDPSKPDGTPRKLMSADKLRNMGWTPGVALADGIASSYAWYLDHIPAEAG